MSMDGREANVEPARCTRATRALTGSQVVDKREPSLPCMLRDVCATPNKETSKRLHTWLCAVPPRRPRAELAEGAEGKRPLYDSSAALIHPSKPLPLSCKNVPGPIMAR